MYKVSESVLLFIGIICCSECFQFRAAITSLLPSTNHQYHCDHDQYAATANPRNLMVRDDGHPWCLAMLKPKNDDRGNVNNMPASSRTAGAAGSNKEEDDRIENPLIVEAKRVIGTDLAIDNPSILSDDTFVWINPFVDEPVGKGDYVVAGRYFRLRSAFPDLDYRCYDFRIDSDDSFTVRCTCRVIGTMQGGFQLRNAILPPNGMSMICPPEGISMTFDPVTMKVTKLCTGFSLDRQVGNTGGLTGVQAASAIAGRPMATWKNLPADLAFAEVNAKRPTRLENPQKGGTSPFPEKVMIQLARGVITTNMGADDPSLLSDDEFSYVTPSTGPINKADYLRHYADFELAGYEPNFSFLRVDPYEPDRVWVDCQPKAVGLLGPPQVLSLSFDGSGCCCRITSSAVLDPSVGNTGGLGGPEGFKYAMSQATAGAVAHSEPRVVSMSDSTSEVDEEIGTAWVRPETLSTTSNVQAIVSAEPRTPSRPHLPPPIEKMTIVDDGSLLKKEIEPKLNADWRRNVAESFEVIPPKKTESTTNIPLGTIPLNQTPMMPVPKSPFTTFPKLPTNLDDGSKARSSSTAQNARPELNQDTAKKSQIGNTGLSPDDFAQSIRIPDFGFLGSPATPTKRPTKDGNGKDTTDNTVVRRLESLKDISASIRIVPEQISRSFSLLIDPKSQEEKAAAETRRREATAKRAAALKAKSALSLKHVPPSLLKDSKLMITRSKPALADRAREDLLARARKKREEERKNGLKNRTGNLGVVPTSGIFGSSGIVKAAAAPRSSATIPRLANWQQNVDGSITGLISGATQYRRNEKITTSPVKLGRIASGNVVRTGTGSRYYLE